MCCCECIIKFEIYGLQQIDFACFVNIILAYATQLLITKHLI